MADAPIKETAAPSSRLPLLEKHADKGVAASPRLLGRSKQANVAARPYEVKHPSTARQTGRRALRPSARRRRLARRQTRPSVRRNRRARHAIARPARASVAETCGLGPFSGGPKNTAPAAAVSLPLQVACYRLGNVGRVVRLEQSPPFDAVAGQPKRSPARQPAPWLVRPMRPRQAVAVVRKSVVEETSVRPPWQSAFRLVLPSLLSNSSGPAVWPSAMEIAGPKAKTVLSYGLAKQSPAARRPSPCLSLAPFRLHKMAIALAQDPSGSRRLAVRLP